MSALVALSIGALATWLLRVSFITVFPADRLPARVRRPLPHVGPAALAALIVSGLAGPGGPAAVFTPAAEHIALLAAGLVAWRFRNLVAPIVAALLVMSIEGAVW
jgi:branched-subunit amino acid transport protein